LADGLAILMAGPAPETAPAPETTIDEPVVLPVAVVIPSYKRPDRLKNALRSVSAQTGVRPCQVIVVDDASGDGSAQVARDLGATVVERSVNAGPSEARNDGVRLADGAEWIALLDDDDEWLPHHLGAIWRARGDHVIVAGSSLDMGGHKPRVHGTSAESGEVIRSPARLVFPENSFTTSAVMVRRDVLLDVGGFDRDIRYGEDFDAWLRVLERGTGLILGRITCLYGLHASQSSLNRRAMFEACEKTLDGYHGRRWLTPALRERSLTVAAWDDLQAARAGHDRGEIARKASWLVARPRRITALASVLSFRRRLRQRAYYLVAEGENAATAPGTATVPEPTTTRVVVTMSGRWPTGSEVLQWSHVGTPRFIWDLLRMAKGADAVVLRGSSGLEEGYVELLAALLIKLRWRHPPRTVIGDATWDITSRRLERLYPRVAKALPVAARLVVRAIDGPHVVYGVLSTEEAREFPKRWGVSSGRVAYTAFCATMPLARQAESTDGDYIFAGGNSYRDYETLVDAVCGLAVPVVMASSWTASRPLPANVTLTSMNPADYDRALLGAKAVVVPIRAASRSAGQQTYLNAMLMGKPVIVTDAPGVRDHIVDGETGWIVAPDPAALRQAIQWVLDPVNAATVARVTETARRSVEEGFLKDHYFARLWQVATARG
jgi:glycosyltransferase involved in cell wall biosynthesis